MKTTTHRQRAEIAAEKRSPFMPHRGLIVPNLFLGIILNRRTWETCPIDCTEALGNIYGNIYQTCHPKGKTYREAQLREIVHSVTVEHAVEHKVICESEPAQKKCGGDKTVAERQPLRASGYDTATSSRGSSRNTISRDTKPPSPNVRFSTVLVIPLF
jgi:hypothetical protein